MTDFSSFEKSINVHYGKINKKENAFMYRYYKQNTYKEIKYTIPNRLKNYIDIFMKNQKCTYGLGTNELYLKSYGIDTKNFNNTFYPGDILEVLCGNSKFLEKYNFYQQYLFHHHIRVIHSISDAHEVKYEWVVMLEHYKDGFGSRYDTKFLLLINLNIKSKFYGKIMMCILCKEYGTLKVSESRLISNSILEFIEKTSNPKTHLYYESNIKDLWKRNDFVLKMDRECMILILLKRKNDPNFIFNFIPIDVIKIIWEFITL